MATDIPITPETKAVLDRLNVPETRIQGDNESPMIVSLELERNRSGKPLATRQNLETIFCGNGGVARYNEIAKCLDITLPNASFSQDNFDQAMLGEVYSLLAHYEYSSSQILEYLVILGDKNKFNPVAEWVLSSEWDGTERIQELINQVETQDNEIRDLVLRKWFVSCVTCWFSDVGRASHIVPILLGDQGIGKDRFCKSLFPPEMRQYILEGHYLDTSDKDSVLIAISNAIVILSEVGSSIQRKQMDKLKAFITSDTDRVRPPYARRDRKTPRRTAFIATTNDRGFLKDDTGNRRFIGLDVVSLNPNHGIDMQQFWAEVYLQSKEVEPFFSPAELKILNRHNEQFEEVNSVEERVKSYFDWEQKPTEPMTATDICIAIGIANPNKSELNQATKTVRNCLGLGRQEYSSKGSGGQKLFSMPPRRSVGQQVGQYASPLKYGSHREF